MNEPKTKLGSTHKIMILLLQCKGCGRSMRHEVAEGQTLYRALAAAEAHESEWSPSTRCFVSALRLLVLTGIERERCLTESCVCAAIRLPSGVVIHGHRHNHCLDAARTMQGVTREDCCRAEQGFVTTTGRFVDRREGMILQSKSGKPSRYSSDGSYCGELLFSEDLY